MKTLHRKVEIPESHQERAIEPTDEDIANAASDYVGYYEDKDTLPIRYLSREQYAIKAYKQGATEMRDNKIYISPKDNTTHPLIPSPQHQVNEDIKYFNKIIQPKKISVTNVCNNWIPDKGTSATRCANCGKDRWQHEL